MSCAVAIKIIHDLRQANYVRAIMYVNTMHDTYIKELDHPKVKHISLLATPSDQLADSEPPRCEGSQTELHVQANPAKTLNYIYVRGAKFCASMSVFRVPVEPIENQCLLVGQILYRREERKAQICCRFCCCCC
jgi:hypothetical protein